METSRSVPEERQIDLFPARILAVAMEPDAEDILLRFDERVLARFAAAAWHLDDGCLALVFTVAHRSASRSHLRPSNPLTAGIDRNDPMLEWARETQARQIEAAAAVVPITARLAGADAAILNQRSLTRMSEEVAGRFADEPFDEALLCGFAVKASLGFRVTGWHKEMEPEYRRVGAHFDLIAAHWNRFREAGSIDESLIAELEALDCSPLAAGVL